MHLNETKEEFLKRQSHRQLEIFVMNGELIEEGLRDRLYLLSGCPNFGGQDGTDGACVECYYTNPQLNERCHLFQISVHSYLGMKSSRKLTKTKEDRGYASQE